MADAAKQQVIVLAADQLIIAGAAIERFTGLAAAGFPFTTGDGVFKTFFLDAVQSSPFLSCGVEPARWD